MNDSLNTSDIQQFESYLINTGIKITTVKKYVRDIKKLAFFLEEHNQKLSQSSLDAFIASLPGSGYGTCSINAIIMGIKAYCKYAGRTDLTCKSLNIRKKSNYENVHNRLTEEEYKQLLDTAVEQEKYRVVLLIQIIAFTDIRLNELCYLTVEALDNGVITVPRARMPYEIFLPQDLLQNLYEYIDYQQITDGIIFCTKKGTALDRGNIWRELKELAVTAGVDPDKVYPQNLKRQFVKNHYTIDYSK